MNRARVSEKGQVTVPKALRDRLGIRPGQELEFSESGDGALIARKVVREDALASVYGMLGNRGPTTDEFMEQLRGPADAC